MTINTFITFIIWLLLTVTVSGCAPDDAHDHQESEASEQHDHEDVNAVTLSAMQMRSIGIALGSVERKQLTASLKANGILKVPNQSKATATAIIGGIVRSILVQPGARVRQGQVIATMTNMQLIEMQEEFLAVSAKVDYALLEYERQQELQAENATARKILQQSEAELKALKARKASLRQQLAIVGVNVESLTSENMRSVVNITSPINGVISKVIANIGDNLEANRPIAEIVDNRQVHLDLFIYEKDLPSIQIGQSVHFTLTYNPGKEYDAQIYGLGSSFEQSTKAIAIHAAVEGDKQGLIDGMNVSARISLESATVNAVPTDAVVSYQGKDYVYIVNARSNDSSLTFSRILVHRGTTDVGYTEITPLSDLPSNATLVVKGAFFLLAKQTNSGEHEH